MDETRCSHAELAEQAVGLRFCIACGELIEYRTDDTGEWLKVS